MYKLFLYFTPHVLEFAAPGTGKLSKEKMIMKEFQYTVKDACGIHARPAGLLVKQGETITIKVEGDDEEAAAAAIQKFLTENV